MKKIKVFISSVMDELREEREATKEAILELLGEPYSHLLGDEIVFEPMKFEDLGARGEAPREMSITKIQEADVYLCIIGKKYGKIKESGLSATHEEYQAAREKWQKRGMHKDFEILVYLLEINERKEIRDKKANDLVKEIEKEHKYCSFKNVHDLKDKIKKDLLRLAIEYKKPWSSEFTSIFREKLDACEKFLIKENSFAANQVIDDMIALIKEQIEKWNVKNVEHATKELLLGLYKYDVDLFLVYHDLFKVAYVQRKHLIGKMIEAFSEIVMKTWITDYDITRIEKCCDVILKLGLEFLDVDLSVSEDCATAIDNFAGDIFEKEVLGRLIILGAAIDMRKSKSREILSLANEVINNIGVDDTYAWDAEYFRYLINSLNYAESICEKYNVDLSNFKKALYRVIKNNQKELIDDFVNSLKKREEDSDIDFDAEYLSKIIAAYLKFMPDTPKYLIGRIKRTRNKKLMKIFSEIVDRRAFLKKIFKGEKIMIMEFKELGKFLEENTDVDDLGVGITLYGPSWVEFCYKLNEEDKEELGKIAKKYDLVSDPEFEVDEKTVNFLVDIFFTKRGKHDLSHLIQFLKEVDNKFKIKTFVTGVEFKLGK